MALYFLTHILTVLSPLNLACNSHPFSIIDSALNVKLDSRETPPPLHLSPVLSDLGRSSTAETTPLGTPRGFSGAYPRRLEKDKDNFFSWHRKATDVFAGSSNAYADSTLLESDLEDSTFPLFSDPTGATNMTTGTVSPIDIASPSQNGSVSPRVHHTSNLTTALQSTSGNEARPTTAVNIGNCNTKGLSGGFGHRDSIGGGTSIPGSHFGSGAQPISMTSSNREKSRRESIAGSLVGGMSWGGVSVGSWIRDE